MGPKHILCLLPLLSFGVRALPHGTIDLAPSIREAITPFYKRDGGAFKEWTAMGDSYASGVGAGPQPADDTNRCFRFPEAYPAVMQSGDGALDPRPEKWNNVACSGNTFDKILEKEFLDKPKKDGKYGVRPAWGDAPEFITLTMGGNDVGILNLIATCIYSLKPFGQDCDQVIEGGHKELEKPEFAENAKKVIQTALIKGRGTIVGSKFAVFVSGEFPLLLQILSVLALKMLMIVQQGMQDSSTKTMSNATTSHSSLAGIPLKQSISPKSDVQR